MLLLIFINFNKAIEVTKIAHKNEIDVNILKHNNFIRLINLVNN